MSDEENEPVQYSYLAYPINKWVIIGTLFETAGGVVNVVSQGLTAISREFYNAARHEERERVQGAEARALEDMVRHAGTTDDE